MQCAYWLENTPLKFVTYFPGANVLNIFDNWANNNENVKTCDCQIFVGKGDQKCGKDLPGVASS